VKHRPAVSKTTDGGPYSNRKMGEKDRAMGGDWGMKGLIKREPHPSAVVLCVHWTGWMLLFTFRSDTMQSAKTFHTWRHGILEPEYTY
jgi:hypothetical protein